MRTIPSRLGPFAIEEQLGDPGASHTYRAMHVERRVSLAIRILPHDALTNQTSSQAFLDNIAELKPLVHENLVRCLGGAVDGGWPHVVFEFVRGESLAERLDRLDKLPWEAAVDIAQGICRGLAYAHARDVLHARIFPANVLIDKTGIVKLAGLASTRIESHEGLVRGGPSIDQIHYLAPEQLEGGGTVTPRSDIYTVGCLLFRMLTGRTPYSAEDMNEMASAKRNEVAPRISSLEMTCPVWLDVLVERLLSITPKDRPASANDVLDALDETKRIVASGMGTAQRALSRKKSSLVRQGDAEGKEELARIRRKRTRRRNDAPFYERAWFLAVCLAALMAGGVYFLWPPSEEVLFVRAARLMQSDDVVDWYRAESDFLQPLKKRFPEGRHAAEVDEYLDQIAMDRAMKRLRINTRLGRPRSCEGERLFARAWEYEQFGDRVAALALYQALDNLLAESDKANDKPYVLLARQRIREIGREQTDAEESQAAFVDRHLVRADKLATEGNALAARQIWESIIALYAGNRELATQVDKAHDRIAAQDTPGGGG